MAEFITWLDIEREVKKNLNLKINLKILKLSFAIHQEWRLNILMKRNWPFLI
ncbi:hypothetical protein AB2I15_02440 [Escherichia coli]